MQEAVRCLRFEINSHKIQQTLVIRLSQGTGLACKWTYDRASIGLYVLVSEFMITAENTEN